MWSKDKPGKVVELEAAWGYGWWGSRGESRSVSGGRLFFAAAAGRTWYLSKAI